MDNNENQERRRSSGASNKEKALNGSQGSVKVPNSRKGSMKSGVIENNSDPKLMEEGGERERKGSRPTEKSLKFDSRHSSNGREEIEKERRQSGQAFNQNENVQGALKNDNEADMLAAEMDDPDGNSATSDHRDEFIKEGVISPSTMVDDHISDSALHTKEHTENNIHFNTDIEDVELKKDQRATSGSRKRNSSIKSQREKNTPQITAQDMHDENNNKIPSNGEFVKRVLSYSNTKIGFIGCNKIAQTLMSTLFDNKVVDPKNLLTSAGDKSEVGQVNLKSMASIGCRTTASNREVMEESDVILLFVKASQLPCILQDINYPIVKQKLIVYTTANVMIQKVEKYLPSCSKVIRVLVNSPAIIRHGNTICCPGTNVDNEDCQLVKDIFKNVGEFFTCAEKYIDAASSISVSGPAFGFQIIEAMSDGAVKQGLPRDSATRMAGQALLGAAKLVLDCNLHPATLKDVVASSGGSTIMGLHELEKGALRSTIINAVEAATKRAAELTNMLK